MIQFLIQLTEDAFRLSKITSFFKNVNFSHLPVISSLDLSLAFLSPSAAEIVKTIVNLIISDSYIKHIVSIVLFMLNGSTKALI